MFKPEKVYKESYDETVSAMFGNRVLEIDHKLFCFTLPLLKSIVVFGWDYPLSLCISKKDTYFPGMKFYIVNFNWRKGNPFYFTYTSYKQQKVLKILGDL